MNILLVVDYGHFILVMMARPDVILEHNDDMRCTTEDSSKQK